MIQLMRQISLMILVASPHLPPTNILPVLPIWATYIEMSFLKEPANYPESHSLGSILLTRKIFGNGWMIFERKALKV